MDLLLIYDHLQANPRIHSYGDTPDRLYMGKRLKRSLRKVAIWTPGLEPLNKSIVLSRLGDTEETPDGYKFGGAVIKQRVRDIINYVVRKYL